MTKSQKKVLQFAYQLVCGDHDGYAYAHGQWIVPDAAPDRPYLNEDTFTRLLLRGYLECQLFQLGFPVWLYRITPEGCAAMGWEWPLETKLKTPSNGRVQPIRQQGRENRRQFASRFDWNAPAFGAQMPWKRR